MALVDGGVIEPAGGKLVFTPNASGQPSAAADNCDKANFIISYKLLL